MKGLVSIGQTLAVLGTSLTSLTKAEINKIGLTPIRSDTLFWPTHGRAEHAKREGMVLVQL